MMQIMKMKPKIMIVDDAEMNRQILMAILGDEYEYVEAENGRQAIHMSVSYTHLDVYKRQGFELQSPVLYIK